MILLHIKIINNLSLYQYFNLTGIPPAPRGEALIEVTFEIDDNGILQVSAIEVITGNKNQVVITNDFQRLSQEEIDKILLEAEEFAEQDRMDKESIDAKNSLESYIYSMKSQIECSGKLANKVRDADKLLITEKIKKIQHGLDIKQNSQKEDYEEKLKELEKICNPIVTRVQEKSGEQLQQVNEVNLDSDL